MFDILEAIETSEKESSTAVIESLLTTYDKALMILEYMDSDDISCFSIFQEVATGKDAAEMSDMVNDAKDSNKNKAKKGILAGISGIISKLIDKIKGLTSSKFEAKKMKTLEKKAKKLGVDLDKLSESEKEMLYASLNSQLTEADINKIMTKRKLKSFGLKAGIGAIVIGGSAYYINNKKELVVEKVNEFKGKIYKKLDEDVLKGVREATDAAVEKISNVADAAAEKIKATADAVKKAVETVINFLKKLFEAFKRFFNIHILRYDKTEVEKVMCKIDPNTGSLHVTFDLSYIEEWIKETKTFISNATQFIGHKVSNGNLEKNVNEEGKSARGGVIAAVQKEHDSATIIKGKNGATLVTDYRNHLEKISNKFNSKVEYQPVDAFVNMASRLAPELNSICDLAKKLNDKYNTMVNNPNRKQTDYLNAEKEVATTLRGILDTQILITESVDAINNYINTVAEMTAALEIGSD